MPDRVVITGGEILDSSGRRRADVAIEDGKVVGVGSGLPEDGADVLDAAGCLVTPSFVDMHTHLREPGGERSETIASGAAAAALGGYGAVVAMANTTPVADNRQVVEFVRNRGVEAGFCHVLPAAAITENLEGVRLAPLGELCGAGVVLFSDDGRCLADAELMRRAMEYLKPFGAIVANHSEDPALVGLGSRGEGEREGVMNEGGISARLGVAGRPVTAETVVIARDLALAEAAGARVHIPHLSTAAGLDIVVAAKARGVSVTAEVTPHHLTLDETACQGFDTNFRVNPPLRRDADVEALIRGLANGAIDAVATDHAPHPPEEKERPFEEAPPGMIGLETALGVLLTDLVARGHLTIERLLDAMSWMPAKILGLTELGFGVPIQNGVSAHLAVIDPAIEWVVDPAAMASSSANSPFAGRRLTGRTRHTVFGGRVIVRNGTLEGATT